MFNIETFAIELAEKFTRDAQARGYGVTYDISVEPGQKFDRLVLSSRWDGRDRDSQRTAHAFVEKATGRLVKCATWRAPARRANGELQSQYNLTVPEEYQRVLEIADFAGGYLYLKR